MDLHNTFYDSCMIYALFNIASQTVEAGQRNFKTAVVSPKCFAGHTKFFRGPRVRHLWPRWTNSKGYAFKQPLSHKKFGFLCQNLMFMNSA